LTDGHKTFHIEAGKVARAVNQGSNNVDDMLGSGTAFNAASSEVTRLIVQLKRELSKPAKPAPRITSPKLSATVAPAGGDGDWETF
jgi:hypothetical protein